MKPRVQIPVHREREREREREKLSEFMSAGVKFFPASFSWGRGIVLLCGHLGFSQMGNYLFGSQVQRSNGRQKSPCPPLDMLS
jgi:hypothetical protein